MLFYSRCVRRGSSIYKFVTCVYFVIVNLLLLLCDSVMQQLIVIFHGYHDIMVATWLPSNQMLISIVTVLGAQIDDQQPQRAGGMRVMNPPGGKSSGLW